MWLQDNVPTRKPRNSNTSTYSFNMQCNVYDIEVHLIYILDSDE